MTVEQLQLAFLAERRAGCARVSRALVLLAAAFCTPTALLASEPPKVVPTWKSGTHTLSVDRRERKFILEVPTDLRTGAPLVMVFHGTGSSAANAQRDCGFSSLVETHGFVAVYPEGTCDTNPDKVPQFQVEYAFQRDSMVDDVDFARKLSQRLVEDLKLDARSVFATGMSNGGDMCYWLACQPEPFVNAIAPVAGTMMVSWGQGLRPRGRTSVLAVHSREDEVTLWDGDLNNRDGWGAYYGTEAVLDLWVKGLALEPVTTTAPAKGLQPRKDMLLWEWRTKKDNTEVRLYEFQALGHTWPPHLGDSDVSTAEEIWRFFDAHRPKAK